MTTEIIIALCASFVSFLAFIVSIVSLFINRKQKQIDNLVTIQQFLHDGALSEARRSIREAATPLTLKEERVRRVCSSFDFAAALVRHGVVDKRIFLSYWRIPLLSLESPLSSLFDESTGSVSIREYYKDFWWLIGEAKKPQRG
jgi:hypothetical protein